MADFQTRAKALQGLLIGLLLATSSPASAAEFQYRSLLQQTTPQLFEHWNREKKEVTGYTSIRYYQEKLGQKVYQVEFSQNQSKQRDVFSEKRIWFEAATGKTVRYLEKDFREKVTTENLYEQDQIKTIIETPEKRKEFKVENEANLLPFELLSYGLRSQLPKLIDKGKLRFQLYLPLLTMELRGKGFPTSFSTLEMEATIEEIKDQKTAFGIKSCIEIKVQPTSFLLKAILPKEKSTFGLTFIKKPPFHLVGFKEGVTESRLIDFQE